MAAIPFDDYLSALSTLRVHADPTIDTDQSREIRTAAIAIAGLEPLTIDGLISLAISDPDVLPALGLTVGLSQEALKNLLKHHVNTSSWAKAVRESAREVMEFLDGDYDLLRLIEEQRSQDYTFADILVARGRTRSTAKASGVTGRLVEDQIEAVALGLGLSCSTRGRFEGRGGRTAPCDLAIPGDGADALIVVAAKGFDSTGSKLTDAVREVEEMAEVRLPTQFTFAAVDGIGWKSRVSDLQRIHALWDSGMIDGMFTMTQLDWFEDQLKAAAVRLGLL